MKNILLYGTLLSALALNGCGTTSNDGTPAPRPITQATLKGTATDAVITNGTLRVFALEDGIKGELLAETTTDGKGDFSIDDFASKDRPIVIEISDGRYTEEASGVSVELIPGQVMRAYLYYREGTAIDVQVTPLTHLSSCLADYKVSKGININNAITEATSVFSGMIGVDILGTKPLDITDPTNANFELTDGLRYGTVLAAISSLTADISETNGVTPHRFNQNSSIYATQVLCQDISSDGIFNGQGFINNTNSVGQLALGSVPIDVDFLRTRVAQHILNIMSSDRNATNLPVGDFVLYANGIAGSTDAVFGGVATTPVDQEGPVVTANLSPDSFLKGLVDLDFTVSDPIGVDTVQFLVNGAPHSAGQVIAPRMSLNTTGFTDGQITVTVVATDMLNNETRMDFNYVVDNSSPTVSLTSPTLTNSQSYTASGTYQEEGASVASITVNGTEAAIDTANRTWSATVSLVSGQNTLELEVVDSAGNTGSFESRVDVDLISPVIAVNDTPVRFTSFQGQLNLCDFGQLNRSSASDNPICISTDNVSLNGIPINSGLAGLGFAVISFNPVDPQGAGVFTQFSDLTVEYKYLLNNEEKIPWVAVPPPPVGLLSFTYYLPMVTEYLGQDWFKVTPNDLHRIIIRVTDKAGNSSEIDWNIKTDILVPELVMSSDLKNIDIFNVPFSLRSSVDLQEIEVEYLVTNPSISSIYISLEDNKDNAVLHKYVSGLRENIVRAKVSEKWFAWNCGVSIVSTDEVCPAGILEEIESISFTDLSLNNKGETLYPSPDKYSDFQSVFTDNPSITELSGVSVISALDGYLCGDPDALYLFYEDRLDTMVIANGRSDFTVCRFREYSYKAPDTFVSSLSSVITEVIENKAGYPRNVITESQVNYEIKSLSLKVFDVSRGVEILPVNGQYFLPSKSTLRILKTVRMPVIEHFNDSELLDEVSFKSYQIKSLDKSTTWVIDTDLDITRAIDPGSIDKLATVTKFTETIGEGLKTFTISR